MKAAVYTRYGSPDALALTEMPQPTPNSSQVLVKVYAASINEWDWGRLRGEPFVNRVMFGLFKPGKKHTIIGCDVSGRVEAVGKGVRQFQPGDEVFGDLSRCGWGGFAEYVCAREDALVIKSPAMTFEEAAAVPQAGLLALQGLRMGQIARGQRVLLNGAGGGVGTFAIQIAKSVGAEVTGVDSTEKLDVMRAIGADHVIDYRQEDFTDNGQTYDLILDVMARRSPSDYRRALSTNGMCIVVGGSSRAIRNTVLLGPWDNKKVKLLLHKPNPADLNHMNELFEGGGVVPVIDKCYPLDDLRNAFQYYGESRHKGKLVITMEQRENHTVVV